MSQASRWERLGVLDEEYCCVESLVECGDDDTGIEPELP